MKYCLFQEMRVNPAEKGRSTISLMSLLYKEDCFYLRVRLRMIQTKILRMQGGIKKGCSVPVSKDSFCLPSYLAF